ncbi:MAG: spore germination protein [Chloroflexi bacterium]|nr:spore germination protein [Chloroflexota bacterium]
MWRFTLLQTEGDGGLKGITMRQMVLILFVVMLMNATVDLPKSMLEYAGPGGWVTILMASVLFGLAGVLVVAMNNRFPGKMLYDYAEQLTGRFIARMLAALFTVYFILYAVLLSTTYCNILHNNFLIKTPEWAVLLISMPVFGYAAYKGITNVARMFEVIGVAVFVVALSIHTAMLFLGRPEYVLPLYIPAETGRVFSALPHTFVPFFGVTLITAVPVSVKKKKRSLWTVFLAIICIGLILAFVSETCIMMIGPNEISHYTDPLVVAIRLVEIPKVEFLTRIDIMYLLFGFMGFYAAIIILYSSAVEFASRMLPKLHRLVTTAAIGLVIFVLSLLAFGIDNFRVVFAHKMVFGPLIAIALTFILWVIAKIKKAGEEK